MGRGRQVPGVPVSPVSELWMQCGCSLSSQNHSSSTFKASLCIHTQEALQGLAVWNSYRGFQALVECCPCDRAQSPACLPSLEVGLILGPSPLVLELATLS